MKFNTFFKKFKCGGVNEANGSIVLSRYQWLNDKDIITCRNVKHFDNVITFFICINDSGLIIDS